MTISMLRNMIKVGRKRGQSSGRDATISVLGKTQSVIAVRPYGLHSNAPESSVVLLLTPEANEANMMMVEVEVQEQDALGASEVAIGIPSETARITAKVGGHFELAGVGDFLARFGELKEGFDQLRADHNALVALYNAHVHPDPVSGTTGVPTTQGTSSTASIDAAKIDELEVSQ